MIKTFEDLLEKMRLEEKVAQLGSVPIWDLMEDGKLSLEKVRKLLANGIGQITRIAGGADIEPREAAEIANTIQKFLLESTRLGIPAIVHEECLSGFMAKGGTTFPQAIGLASTWEPKLIQQMTSVIRKQMRAVGAHQGLSPVLDVARDPRWGRVEETFGEDPYLVACMGVAYVKGLQGDNLKNGIIATLKHFAGHGFSEGGRNCAPVHLGERELREVFLFPFERAVKEAGAQSVMNAYHDIDGVPCAASRKLLTKILRQEWGFKGIVVSDYNAIKNLCEVHRTAANKKEAASQALEAGIDLELPKLDCYGEPLLEAIKEGLISEAVLDNAVKRILRAKMILGLFENLYVDPEKASSVFDMAEHRHLALEIARKSIILLKNEDGLLPLKKNLNSIAVIGPNAATTANLLGDYAYTVHLSCEKDAVPIVSILEGIKSKVSRRTKIHYAKGCDISGASTKDFAEAIEAAKNSEVAILILGGKSGLIWALSSNTSGEGCDRADIELPGVQKELVKAVYNTGTPLVVVLINGRPLSIEWIAQHIPAVVEAWLPGEEGGNAVADVLFGDYVPAGRLPVSLPRKVGQVPINYSRKPSSFKDYLFTKGDSLFPFGYGLSYTRFEYSDIKIAPKKVRLGGEITISLKIKNIGDSKGEEVAQLYIGDVVASVTRPAKELKGFERVVLENGEEKRVIFKLSLDQLAFYNREMKLVVEPGTFKVMIGSSSEDIKLQDSFEYEL